MLRKPLDYETLTNFTVRLRAQDQGSPPKFSDTTLRVIVEDADDQNPKFLRESYRVELLADARPGDLVVLPEPIKAVDQVSVILNPMPDNRINFKLHLCRTKDFEQQCNTL